MLFNRPEYRVNKRYFFHVIGDGHTDEDKTGTVLSGIQAATVQASVLAAELAKEQEYRRFMVYVVDEDGHEVVRRSIVTG